MKNRRKQFLFSLLIVFCSGAVLIFATARTVQMSRWEYGHVSKGEVPEKMVGINIIRPQDINKLDVMPDIVSWFENWYSDSGAAKLELCGRNNAAIPLITWQPVDISFEAIVKGEHDEYIQNFLKRLDQTCPNLTVLVRFAHEMEMAPDYDSPWYQWQGLDAKLYIRAWRHIVRMSRKICPQVKWIWSPNIMTEYANPYYPGDKYVDYVGITVNLPAYTPPKHYDFGDYFQEVGKGERLREFNKPIIVSEIGFHSKRKDKADSVQFIRSVFKFFNQDIDMVAIVFMDINDKRKGRKYKFTDNEACVDAFCDEIHELRAKQKKTLEKKNEKK